MTGHEGLPALLAVGDSDTSGPGRFVVEQPVVAS